MVLIFNGALAGCSTMYLPYTKWPVSLNHHSTNQTVTDKWQFTSGCFHFVIISFLFRLHFIFISFIFMFCYCSVVVPLSSGSIIMVGHWTKVQTCTSNCHPVNGRSDKMSSCWCSIGEPPCTECSSASARKERKVVNDVFQKSQQEV